MASYFLCDRRFSMILSRANAWGREVSDIRFTFRNEIPSALTNERLSSRIDGGCRLPFLVQTTCVSGSGAMKKKK